MCVLTYASTIVTVYEACTDKMALPLYYYILNSQNSAINSKHRIVFKVTYKFFSKIHIVE